MNEPMEWEREGLSGKKRKGLGGEEESREEDWKMGRDRMRRRREEQNRKGEEKRKRKGRTGQKSNIGKDRRMGDRSEE